eukprot:6379303-Amphidinium_carterae.1
MSFNFREVVESNFFTSYKQTACGGEHINVFFKFLGFGGRAWSHWLWKPHVVPMQPRCPYAAAWLRPLRFKTPTGCALTPRVT